MTWRDREGFCQTSRRGTTPAVATKSPIFFFLLVQCLPSLGHGIIVSRLPCLPLPPFAFPPSPRHQAACLLCFEARIVSSVGDGSSPPQYRGYWVEPTASCGGILTRALVRLGTGHGGGPLSKFDGQASGKWVVSLSR